MLSQIKHEQTVNITNHDALWDSFSVVSKKILIKCVYGQQHTVAAALCSVVFGIHTGQNKLKMGELESYTHISQNK